MYRTRDIFIDFLGARVNCLIRVPFEILPLVCHQGAPRYEKFLSKFLIYRFVLFFPSFLQSEREVSNEMRDSRENRAFLLPSIVYPLGKINSEKKKNNKTIITGTEYTLR